MGSSLTSAQFLIDSRMKAARRGDIRAYYDLGIVYSTGAGGVAIDLIEAHKWFNLAAVQGHDAAQACRAEIADDMSAREVAEAQRQARAWIAMTQRRAA